VPQPVTPSSVSQFVGIDLGTSFSLIGRWSESECGPQLISNALGSTLTPSVVSVADDGAILVGESAKDRLISNPEQTAALFKRSMGTRKTFKLGKQDFKPEELSALVIQQLLEDYMAATGTKPTNAIISVPAYFGDAQRKSTKIAGELAGLKVERLINEPTAAALAYGVQEKADDQTIAVVDLGGGTLDVSILEYFSGVIQVRASTGDRALGGADFDELLIELALHQLELIRLFLDSKEEAQIARSATKAKHELSNGNTAQLGFSRKEGKLIEFHKTTVSRSQFEEAASGLLAKLSSTINQALRDSRIRTSELDEVLLVGGATRIPMVRSTVGRLFGRLPNSHLRPDEVVAMGAVIQAALIADRVELEDVVLTDVAPYTMGVEVAVEKGTEYESGHFLPIIERNTPVPVSRVETVSPIRDDQDSIECRIFQGESRLTKNNILLGKIDQKLFDSVDRSVDIRFTYNINGVLEVSTIASGSEESQRLVISNSDSLMTEEEIEQSIEELSHLKLHPRELAESQALIARADRMFEEALGADRETIRSLLVSFDTILDKQDVNAAAQAREELAKALDDLERFQF